MAAIKNIDGLTNQDIIWELNNGGKFVVYQYTVSIIVMTFKRGSNIYFIRGGQSGVKHSIGFTILTFLFGWWGIPWGPIYSIGSLYTNMSGGKDVTQHIVSLLNEADDTKFETLHD
jgi:hypothetical protein